jgi:hypothetical protein
MSCERQTPYQIRKFVQPKDINALQLAPSQAHFEAAVEVFADHYSPQSPELSSFITYFLNSWSEDICCWYEGIHTGLVTSNSGIEGTNNTIKAEGTFRERLNLFLFTDIAKRLIVNWGKERNPASPNCKVFASETRLDTKDYTDAYLWAKENVRTFELFNNERRYIVFFSRQYTGRVSNRKAEKVLGMHLDPDTMDSVQNMRLYLNHARILEANEDETGYICSCINFKKDFKCRHSIGGMVRERRITVPPEARTVLLGQKRTRGRPAHAAPALQMQ